MTYEEAMKYLSRAKTRSSILGLDNMRALCEELDNPQDQSVFIHVGGTNGKGSVIAFISSILSEAGYMVGRYVSPVVFQYEEMIQFQTKNMVENISKEELADGIAKIYEAERALIKAGINPPTLFEIETALAFLTFAKRKCDIVLLEVGLGGRLDATNIIRNPIASVITPISLDHTGVLGETIAEVAWEKAGIIKQNGFVISSEQQSEAMSVLKEVCAKQNAHLIKVETRDAGIFSSDLEGTKFLFGGNTYTICLLGDHQVRNAIQAVFSVRHLPDINVSEENITTGLKKARWDGRFQVINRHPLTIIDGAHNPEGAKALKNCLKRYVPEGNITGIMGVFADKDYEGICREVLPLMNRVIVVPAEGKRTLSPDRLMGTAKKYISDVMKENNILTAYKKCLKDEYKAEAVVIFGTLSFLKDLTDNLAEVLKS